MYLYVVTRGRIMHQVFSSREQTMTNEDKSAIVANNPTTFAAQEAQLLRRMQKLTFWFQLVAVLIIPRLIAHEFL